MAKSYLGKQRLEALVPPPNITGRLHLGHAYNMHLLYLYSSLLGGRMTHGADHAGLSAQVKVIGSDRSVSRAEVVRRMGPWCRDALANFRAQWKVWGLRMGDYHFSLEERFRSIVYWAFQQLLDRGYALRSLSHVNVEVGAGAVISDAEVKERECEGTLYRLVFRAADGGEPLLVDTSRPDTILADVALCVHPEDPRSALVGREYVVPLTGKRVRLHAHPKVRLGFGTGVLKLTPRYDRRDYEIALELGLELGEAIYDESMRAVAPGYEGLDLDGVTSRVIAGLRQAGLLVGEETYRTVARFFSSRLGDRVVEVPVISVLQDGYFIKIGELARKHRALVSEAPVLEPAWIRNEVESWLERLDLWCVSRSIGWGFPIPGDERGRVFDTWFNAALWPLLKVSERPWCFDCLVTGNDLVMFWYIKMAALCAELTGRVAFRTAFFHGLLVDKSGQKMSKSLGNVVEPDEVIARLGRDLFRLTVLRNVSKSKFIRHEEPFEASKLVNKLYSVLKYLGPAGREGAAPAGLEPDAFLSGALRSFRREARALTASFRFRELFELTYSFVQDVLSREVIDGFRSAGIGEAPALRTFLSSWARFMRPVLPEFAERLKADLAGLPSRPLVPARGRRDLGRFLKFSSFVRRLGLGPEAGRRLSESIFDSRAQAA